MAATLDMITSGDDAGTLIHPLQYTTTDDDVIRVNAWLQLATPLGKYLPRTSDGLDHELLIDAGTSDEERAAWVRTLLLAVEGVADIIDGPTISTEDSILTITATCRTVNSTSFVLGL